MIMKVKVQQGREEINSIGGISLIGGLFNSLKSLKKVDSMRMNKVKTGKIKHNSIFKTIAGLFTLGKNDYETGRKRFKLLCYYWYSKLGSFYTIKEHLIMFQSNCFKSYYISLDKRILLNRITTAL